MQKKSGNLIDHWSYSSWGAMRKCPQAFYYGQILKLRGPPVPAMERGTMIHSLAEHYLIGDITGGVPLPLRKLSKEFRALKDANPIVEQYWGVSSEWKPMKYGWLVAKTDAAVLPTKKENILIVVDHKTGREYPEHPDQGSLYGSVGFGLFPNVDKVEVEFFYTDQGYVRTFKFTRAQLRWNVKYWLEQGRKLMATKSFLPTPSHNACDWCGFRSDKKLAGGKPGPCTAWKILDKL